MTTNAHSHLLTRLESLARQLQDPLDTEQEGFALCVREASFRVRFPYSVTLNRLARAVPDALWIKSLREWSWPLEEYLAARAARDQIIQTQHAMWQARESLFSELFLIYPSVSVKPAFERNVGDIVGVNSFFVAQRIGASLCVLHESAALSAPVMQGETRSIFYKNGHGIVASLVNVPGGRG